MSLSPAWQLGQLSGRRTVETTRSPRLKPDTPAPTASTTLSASCPITRKFAPGGGSPYSPWLISVAVPSMPTSNTRISALPGAVVGFGSSTCRALPGCLGVTATARIVAVNVVAIDLIVERVLIESPVRQHEAPAASERP